MCAKPCGQMIGESSDDDKLKNGAISCKVRGLTKLMSNDLIQYTQNIPCFKSIFTFEPKITLILKH